LSPFVTKFAYYRLLTATIANGLPREKPKYPCFKNGVRIPLLALFYYNDTFDTQAEVYFDSELRTLPNFF